MSPEQESVLVKPVPLSAQQREWLEKAWAQIDRERLTRLAMDMVNIPSRTGEEADLARFMVDYMNGVGLEAFYQHIEERRGNAIGMIRGSGEGPDLLFNGHMDTSWTGVAEEDYPLTGPQRRDLKSEAYLEDGNIRGLGAGNMKGPDACSVMAVEAVKRAGIPLKGTAMATLVSGEIEKCQVQGAVRSYMGRHYMGEGIGCEFMLLHGIRSDYAINVEPGYQVIWEDSGLCWFKVQIKGVMGYVGTKGGDIYRNAIVEATKVINGLEEWGQGYTKRHHKGLTQPQMAIGAIEAGWPYKPGMIPGICNIYMDVRTNPRDELMEVKREFGEAIQRIKGTNPGLECDWDMYLSDPGSMTDPNNWIVQSVIRAWEHVEGKKHVNVLGRSGSSDTNVTRRWGIPTARLGPHGSIREPSGRRSYGEACDIDLMYRATKCYVYAIIDTCTRTREEVGLPRPGPIVNP
ncbi:MAG: M20/M25/M40 family metallo-hydrolase [Chloroflexi bacterium]|nr:M20/M25/M40 family metallo-hydrolase [Chloroflexota bacterium]